MEKRLGSQQETVAKRRRVLEALSEASGTLQHIKEDLGEEKFEFPEHATPELKQELIPLFMQSKELKPQQLEEYLHNKDLKKLYEITEHANYFDAANLFEACKVVIAQKITRKEGARKLLASGEFPLIRDVNKSLVPLCLSKSAMIYWLVKEKMMTNDSDGFAVNTHFLEKNNHRISSVTFNPAGTLVVGAGFGNDFEIWDSQSRSLIAAIPNTGSVGYSVAFSNDGTLLANGCSKGKVIMYDPKSLQHIAIHSLQDDNRVSCIVFNPSGQLLACGASSGKISLLQPVTGAVVRTFSDQSSIFAMAFDKKDTVFVTGSAEGALKVWDHHAGMLKTTLQERGLAGIWSVALNRMNTILASGSETGQIKLWDFPSGSIRRLLQTRAAAQSVIFHPNDYMLISGDEQGNVGIYDVHSGTQLFDLQYQGRSINAIDINHSGTMLACGYEDGGIALLDICNKQISDYLERDITTPEAVLFEYAYVLKRSLYKAKFKVNKKIMEKIPSTLRTCLLDALDIEIIE